MDCVTLIVQVVVFVAVVALFARFLTDDISSCCVTRKAVFVVVIGDVVATSQRKKITKEINN